MAERQRLRACVACNSGDEAAPISITVRHDFAVLANGERTAYALCAPCAGRWFERFNREVLIPLTRPPKQ
jgi:hypothetical protein